MIMRLRILLLLMPLLLIINASLAIIEIDSLEWDTSNGRQPSIIHIGGNIYAVAYRGDGNDGFVKTFTIESDGNIGASVIDSLEFDEFDCAYPDLIHIDGDVYAVAYAGTGNDGWLATFTIDAGGQISDSIIDSFEWDVADGAYPDIIHISGNVYVIAYTGSGADGWVTTVTINNDGTIVKSNIDSFEWDTADGLYPSIIKVGDNIYAVAYTGSGADGWIKSFQINNDGTIVKSIIDSFEWDADNGQYPRITHVSGNYYAIPYTGTDTDGFIITLSISSSGMITPSVIDSLEFDPIECYWPSITRVSGDYFVIAYRGSDVDGWLATVTIDSSGNIGDSVFSSYEFDDTNVYYTSIKVVSGNIFAVAFEGNGNDGWVKTFDLSPAYCGDSICQAGETYLNCPADCCESDCTATTDSICHAECNGYAGCTGFISACNNQAVGYLTCADSNNVATCCKAQTPCSSGLYCNAGVCSECSSVCDGVCSGGATCYGIDPDCDSSGDATLPCCGNDKCEGLAGESAINCPADCGAAACSPATCSGSCGVCREYSCVGVSCVCQVVSNCCGNNVCEPPNETFASCPVDCLAPSSVNVVILEPLMNQVFMRGDNLTVRVNVTFDAGIRGINANVTAVTPAGIITLYDDGAHGDGASLDGVYSNSIIIPKNSSLGSQSVEVTAVRGVTGASARNIQISNTLSITLSTDKTQYIKNELIRFSGSIIDSLGRFINGSLIITISSDEVLIDSLNVTATGGLLQADYRTVILDPEGLWQVSAIITDLFNNTGLIIKELNITEPPSGAYLTVSITSPSRGAVKRGWPITITADVSLSSITLTGAVVTAKLPDGSSHTLSERGEGIYSSGFTIPFNAPSGKWDLEIIAQKGDLSGVAVQRMDVDPADINIQVLSPTKSVYGVGEDLIVQVQVTYPDPDAAYGTWYGGRVRADTSLS